MVLRGFLNLDVAKAVVPEQRKQEFMFNNGADAPIHVKEIRIQGKVHKNKMERLNGEIRDREKTFRGLKTADSPILKGYQIFHNFVRPHEALGGDTPADRVGIKVEGPNKWLTLQNASKQVATQP